MQEKSRCVVVFTIKKSAFVWFEVNYLTALLVETELTPDREIFRQARLRLTAFR